MSTQPKLDRFNENVLAKFRLYNSVFMTLPYDTIKKTGVLLPLFHETCKNGFEEGKDPTAIVDTFFKNIKHAVMIKAVLIYYSVLFNI